MSNSKVRGTGAKTQEVKGQMRTVGRLSRSAVQNLNPVYDYCFVRKVDMEANGGMYMGYEAVDQGNSSGEIPWAPPGVKPRSANAGKIFLEDTVLCRRPKETSEYYKSLWLEKASANFQLVRQSAKNAGAELNKLDPLSYVSQKVNMTDMDFNQTTGPTEE
jgi:hypothetical protein